MKTTLGVLSRLRQTFLDRRNVTIDRAAFDGEKTVVARVIVLVLGGMLLGANINGATATAWTLGGLLSEAASHGIRLALRRSPDRHAVLRVAYLFTAAAVSLVWSAMPLLYWLNGVSGIEMASVLILTMQLIHAQAFSYRSTPVLLVVGGIPSIVLLVMPWLGTSGTGLHLLTNNLAVLLAIGYTLASVTANRKTARVLKSAQDELERLASSDMLTSVANRRGFNAHLRSLVETSRQNRTRFALLLIDLDRFKQINDTLGHDAGDAMLVEISAQLQRTVRTGDYIARLGGDEFALILKNVDHVCEIGQLCAGIASSSAGTVDVDGRRMTATLSVGVAVFPEHGDEPESLYKSADMAMYEAKRCGGATWRYSQARTSGRGFGENVGQAWEAAAAGIATDGGT